MKMFKEELEYPGTWLVKRCADTEENFVYQTRAQSQAGGPSKNQAYQQLVSRSGAMAAKGYVMRSVLVCGCPGWKMLKDRGTKSLCKYSGFLLLFCRHAWKMPLVALGPRRQPSVCNVVHRAIGDFVEVALNAARSCKLDEPLMISFADEQGPPQRPDLQRGLTTKASQDDQLQDAARVLYRPSSALIVRRQRVAVQTRLHQTLKTSSMTRPYARCSKAMTGVPITPPRSI